MADRKADQLKEKNNNTPMETIEKIYGKDFGVPNDKNLGNYLKEIGYSGLSQLLKNG